jgi:hypothetical protein
MHRPKWPRLKLCPLNCLKTISIPCLQGYCRLQKNKTVQRARTIPASKFVFRHIRLAAAAVLLLCIGLGAYTTVFNTGYTSPHRILRSVPQSEIEAYLETTDKNEGEDISARNLSFDSKDIVVYLNETGWE